VELWGGELGSAIRKVVGTIHLCAPTVVGVSVAEAEARLKELEGEILQQLHLLDEAKTFVRDRVADQFPVHKVLGMHDLNHRVNVRARTFFRHLCGDSALEYSSGPTKQFSFPNV
jgi:hypothetical protein